MYTYTIQKGVMGKCGGCSFVTFFINVTRMEKLYLRPIAIAFYLDLHVAVKIQHMTKAVMNTVMDRWTFRTHS